MSSVTPYDEALRIIRQHPGTSGASGLAKLLLSLYNSMCGYSFAECVSSLDDRLTNLALRMVQDYAANGETADLIAAGKIIADDLYPGLWEASVAMHEAREATYERWKQEEREREAAETTDAENAFIANVDRRDIPPETAIEMLVSEESKVDASYYSYGNWRNKVLTLDEVTAAIREKGTGFTNWNPESSSMLGVICEGRLYYVHADYDVRETYLASRARK
jgi:hypothetical protein